MTYWNIDDADGNSLSQGIQSEIEARPIAQSTANRLGKSVYLYEVGNGDGESEVESEEIAPEPALPADAVLVETMPDHLRGAHRAAGNWGTYPHNGAERRVMSRAGAEATISGEYDHIVRSATVADAKRYEIAPE